MKTIKDIEPGHLFFMFQPWNPYVMLTTPYVYAERHGKRVQYLMEVTAESIDDLPPYGMAQEHYEVATIEEAKSYIKYEFYGN